VSNYTYGHPLRTDYTLRLLTYLLTHWLTYLLHVYRYEDRSVVGGQTRCVT